jgi:hypothetical protein
MFRARFEKGFKISRLIYYCRPQTIGLVLRVLELSAPSVKWKKMLFQRRVLLLKYYVKYFILCIQIIINPGLGDSLVNLLYLL